MCEYGFSLHNGECLPCNIDNCKDCEFREALNSSSDLV